MGKWFETGGNIRQQHSPFLPPAGKGIELISQDDGEWVRAKIFEPGAMKLVLGGAYQAYSVGLSAIRKIRDLGAPNGRIIDGNVVEVSLVDRPANATTKIEICKAEGYKPSGAFIYTGGFDEPTYKAIVAEYNKAANSRKSSGDPYDDHSGILVHAHEHLDGTAHNHAHAHDDGTANHEGGEHQHSKSDSITVHKSSNRHLSADDHMHVHTDGTVHTHGHDHTEDHPDHDTHKHVGADFAKSAAITTHSDSHTDDKMHDHTHLKGDKFINAGDSHSHPHDHAEGEGGHDGHIPQHDTLLPDSQKVLRSEPVAGPASSVASQPASAGRLDGAAALATIGTPSSDPSAAATALAAQVADALKSVDSDTSWEWVNSETDPEPYPVALKAAIPKKEGEPKTPPKGYPEDKSKYGDPENYSWPLDTDARVHAAVSYYNAGKGKSKYDTGEWSSLGRKIVAAANKAFGGGYSLGDDGKIDTPNNQSSDKGKHSTPIHVKNGVAQALGPTAVSLLFQMLQQEVQEDGGSGEESCDIEHIAKSYAELCEYLESEADEGDEDAGSPIAMGLYSAVPNSLKLLHDVACPATDLPVVKAAYPDQIKGGMLAALTVPTATLRQILASMVDVDAGTGRAAKGLQTTAALYDALRALAPQHSADPGQAELDLSSALATVRKDFSNLVDERGRITNLPAFRPPSQAVPGAERTPPQQPEQFIRSQHGPGTPPPQGDIREAQGAPIGLTPRQEGILDNPGQSPPKPVPPPDPSDFDRNAPTPGQQRYLPAAAQVKADTPDLPTTAANNPGTPTTVANRRYYTRAAGDKMTQSLRTIHDNLVAMHPDICPAMQAAADASKSGGYGAATSYRQTPHAVANGSLPAPATYPAVKAATSDTMKAATTDHGAEQPEYIKALVAELQQLRADRTEDRKLIERLAAEPDPNRAAYRGTVGIPVEKISHANEAQKRARMEELSQRARFIDSWLRQGQPDPGGRKAQELMDIKDELGVPA